MALLLGDRITRDQNDLIVERLTRFARRHRLDLEFDDDEGWGLPAAKVWSRVVHVVGPEDDPVYRSAIRLLNRAITGKDGTYWQGLWHDGAHPHRPQPTRYVKQ